MSDNPDLRRFHRLRRIVRWITYEIRKAGEAVIDARLGVDTAPRDAREAPDLNEAQALLAGFQHWPSPYGILARALGDWQITSNDVFLDIGCGKGRMLYMAAQYPFARVLGVEISPQLANIARSNALRWPSRAGCPIEVYCADAATFVIPPDVTLVYLFNPFDCATTDAVVKRLRQSIEQRPRRLRIIYLWPTCRDAVVQHGFIRTNSRPHIDRFEWTRELASAL